MIMHTETNTTIPGALSVSLGLDNEQAFPAFQIIDRQIVFREDIEWGTYVNVMSAIRSFKRDSSMFLSQGISFGTAKFGSERVNSCMAQLEFDLNDVKKAIEVSTIPPSIMHDNLGQAHYLVLSRSGLKQREMDQWAKKASDQKLDAATLKASISAGEVISPQQARANNHGILSLHGISMSIEVWLRRAGGLDALRTKEKAERKMLAEQIKLAVDIYKALTALPPNANKKILKLKKNALGKASRERHSSPSESIGVPSMH